MNWVGEFYQKQANVGVQSAILCSQYFMMNVNEYLNRCVENALMLRLLIGRVK